MQKISLLRLDKNTPLYLIKKQLLCPLIVNKKYKNLLARYPISAKYFLNIIVAIGLFTILSSIGTSMWIRYFEIKERYLETLELQSSSVAQLLDQRLLETQKQQDAFFSKISAQQIALAAPQNECPQEILQAFELHAKGAPTPVINALLFSPSGSLLCSSRPIFPPQEKGLSDLTTLPDFSELYYGRGSRIQQIPSTNSMQETFLFLKKVPTSFVQPAIYEKTAVGFVAYEIPFSAFYSQIGYQNPQYGAQWMLISDNATDLLMLQPRSEINWITSVWKLPALDQNILRWSRAAREEALRTDDPQRQSLWSWQTPASDVWEGHFISRKPLNTVKWHAIATVPQKMLFAQLFLEFGYHLVLISVISIVGFYLSSLVARKLSSSVQHLASFATQAQNKPTEKQKTGILEIDSSLDKIEQTRFAKDAAIEAMQLWQAAADGSSSGLALLKFHKGKMLIERANKTFYTLCGLDEEPQYLFLEDLPSHSVLQQKVATRELRLAIELQQEMRQQVCGLDPFGKELHVSFDVRPIFYTDPAWNSLKNKSSPSNAAAASKNATLPSTKYFALTLDDITEVILRERQLELQHTTDTLTGLPNRTLFTDRLHQAIEFCFREQRKFALVLFNIDRFKQINDTLGHDMGDALLIAVAKRLDSKLRPGDTLCRLSSDEFGIILNESSMNSMEILTSIDLVSELLRQEFWLDQHRISVSFSMGICMYPEDGDQGNLLLQRADIALFQAKEQGGGKMLYFDNTMRERFEERALLEKDMKTALKEKEFEIYYQPKIDLNSLRPVGMEALLRWQSKGRGFVSPAKFIPLAEESGLIGELGLFALEQALFDTKHLQTKGYHVPVAVNISAKQLEQGFLEQIKTILQKTQIGPHMLHAEITESLILPNSGEALGFFKELEKMGVDISMDDFGTGWSNLGTLKKLPLNALKLDRSFVDGLGFDSEDEALSVTVISMAKALGLYVIAEGVETLLQAQILKQIGAEQAQGYLFAKPMNKETLEIWLAENYHGIKTAEGTLLSIPTSNTPLISKENSHVSKT